MQALMWGFCSGHCSKAHDDMEAPDLMSTLVCDDVEDHQVVKAAALSEVAQFQGLPPTPSMSTPVAAQPRAPKNVISLDASIQEQEPQEPAPVAEKEERRGSKSSTGSAESKGTKSGDEARPAKKAVAKKQTRPVVRPAAVKAAAAEKAKAEKAAADKAEAEAVAKAKADKAKAEAEAQQLQMKGEAEVKQSNLTAAVLSFSQAIELHREYPAAWAGRGGANLRLGGLQAALADLDEALRLDGKLLLAICNRAEVKLSLQDLNGAIEDYNNYLMLAPCDGRALYQRGDAKQRNGMRDEAEKDFKLAKRLGYTERKPQRGGC